MVHMINIRGITDHDNREGEYDFDFDCVCVCVCVRDEANLDVKKNGRLRNNTLSFSNLWISTK